MDKDEATKKIREAAEKGNIEFAPQDLVEKYYDRLMELIEDVLGIKSCWISDMSTLSDFLPGETSPEWGQARQKLWDDYGVDATYHMTFADLAKEIWG